MPVITSTGTFCHKVDIFVGGSFSADVTDSGCTNPVFVESINYSIFGTSSGDTAFFTPGIEGFTGTFSIREDDKMTSSFEVDVLTFDHNALLFTINLIFPTCASPSTIHSSSIASVTPS